MLRSGDFIMGLGLETYSKISNWLAELCLDAVLLLITSIEIGLIGDLMIFGWRRFELNDLTDRESSFPRVKGLCMIIGCI